MKSVEIQASQLRKIVDKVSKVDGVVAIVQFGSHARGEADEGSDIDILVVFEARADRR